MEGAEALAFFGVLALGFRTSRFERFWPLAIRSPAGRRHMAPRRAAGPLPHPGREGPHHARALSSPLAPAMSEA
jgi:hypothetical protein